MRSTAERTSKWLQRKSNSRSTLARPDGRSHSLPRPRSRRWRRGRGRGARPLEHGGEVSGVDAVGPDAPRARVVQRLHLPAIGERDRAREIALEVQRAVRRPRQSRHAFRSLGPVAYPDMVRGSFHTSQARCANIGIPSNNCEVLLLYQLSERKLT